MIHLRTAVILLIVVTFTAAAAQDGRDVARDYEAAHDIFYPRGETKPIDGQLAGLDLIPRIAGLWLPAHSVFNLGEYDVEREGEVCARLPLRIEPQGPMAFTVTRMHDGAPAPFSVTYTFAGGLTFTRTTDLRAFISYIYRTDDLDSLQPGMIAQSVMSPNVSGTAQVLLLGPDVLVIAGTRAPAEIYTRCPG